MDIPLKYQVNPNDLYEFFRKIKEFYAKTGQANPDRDYQDKWLVQMCQVARQYKRKGILPISIEAGLNSLGFKWGIIWRLHDDEKVGKKETIDIDVDSEDLGVCKMNMSATNQNADTLSETFSFNFDNYVPKEKYEKFVKTIASLVKSGYTIKIKK